MPPSLHDRQQRNAERVLTNLRTRIEAARLLAGITLAVATTLVATALQVGTPANAWDWAASWSLFATFVATLGVVGWDGWTEPEGEQAERLVQQEGWTDDDLAKLLRLEEAQALTTNRAAADVVQRAMIGQIGLSFVSGTLAAISLLTT